MTQQSEQAAQSAFEAEWQRHGDLATAAKIFGVDIGNSGDAVAIAIEGGRLDAAREAVELLRERLARGEELLEKYPPAPAAKTEAATNATTAP